MNRKLVLMLTLTLLVGMLDVYRSIEYEPVTPTEVQVGVKAGDWIKCTYTISGWPSGTPYPEWLKVEFLSVEGTNATVRVTMHMSDGTEQNATVPVDVVTGGQGLGLSGLVIPANATTGDSIYMSGYGNVTIAGEATGSYAGASRTVVYASFSQYGSQLTYHWDKLTGVMVEASTISGGVTGTAKATETNMWQASGTIYIMADGSIDPPDAPISTVDNVTYTLTGNITSDASGIVVERNNITIDGSGYTLQGSGDGVGVWIYSGVNDVTVKNTNVKGFYHGIYLYVSSYNVISGNNITDNNYHGIYLIEDSYHNAIFGNNIINNTMGGISLFSNSYNNVSGNVITDNHGYGGIRLDSSSYTTFSENIISNNDNGILVESSFDNNVHQNIVTNSQYDGIFLGNSNNNTVIKNDVKNNNRGVHAKWSANNTFEENRIDDNKEFGIVLWECESGNIVRSNMLSNNTYNVGLTETGGALICHNSFFKKDTQVYGGLANTWDNGYPSGGNYWSVYNGTDSNHDGIGDSNYTIDANNNDRYPLMGMFTEFNATSKQHVQTICNSTISDFQFNGTAISFNVSGENDTTGFCRICIPTGLMNTTYKVFVNGTEISYNLLPCSNEAYSYLYFNYTHSTEQVIIIPEFPSFFIVPLFLSTTLLVVIFFRRKQKKDWVETVPTNLKNLEVPKNHLVYSC